jgi:hypothetical protein
MHPDDDVSRNIRNEMQADAAAGAAREAQERHERRLKEGKCPACGDTFANPALPANWCSECANSTDSVCSSSGCLGDKVGYYYERPYCEAHLIEILQSQHQEYLELGAEYNELEQEFHDKCADRDVDPKEVFHSDDEELQQLELEMSRTKSTINTIKQRIEKAIDRVDKIYPDEADFEL